MAESIESGNVKERKRQTAKTATRQSVAKVKATLHISAEASLRLTVHAAMTGMDRSELVEALITKHCRRYVVSDRGREEDETAGGEGAA